MKTQKLLPYRSCQASSSVHINGVCNYRDEGDLRVIFANAIPILLYPFADTAMERLAMIHLTESGLASQQEVGAAFGCSRLTIFRSKKKYDQGGIAALVPGKRGPKSGSRVKGVVSKRILALKRQGLSHAAIGVRLGLKQDTVRKALTRMGWAQPKSDPPTFPIGFSETTVEPEETPVPDMFETCTVENKKAIDITLLSEASPVEPEGKPEESTGADTPGSCPLEVEQKAEVAINSSTVEQACDQDPSNRVLDRAFARLGLIEDAAPLFGNATDVANVGVLLTIPALIKSGIVPVVKKLYGSLGASFYGLRTTVITLLLIAHLRIKKSESLKEYCPRDLGRLMGLDRACEVKTLRRKLTRLAGIGKASLLGQELAKIRLKQRSEVIGFFYVDGHVRVYHGKRKIAKAYVTQRRLSMPATLDYWVNDQQGSPVFVVTSPANEGLVAMLRPILVEIKSLIGDQRCLTIVFDRGGWSPKLFCMLIEQGFHIITYRKGKIDPIAEDHFFTMAETIEGKRIQYQLHDCSVSFLEGKCWLRQVTRLNSTGHQTHIVTSRQDLSSVTIAYRMFERWRQENFFKYMREEFALDALVDYDVEQDDPERLVPNPKRKEIAKKRQKIKAEVAKLQSQYGQEVLQSREPEKAGSSIPLEIEALKKKELELRSISKGTPGRIPLKDSLKSGDTAVRLSREKKHFTDIIKLVAYQAETDLFTLIQPYYARFEDEGRTLIQSALRSSGSLKVTDDELRVTLNSLSSPHRSRVIKELCGELNKMKAVFPGSKLCMVYDIKEEGHVT